MPVTVTMLQTRKGEDGSLWTAGNSYSATDAFAYVLITGNLATGTLPAVVQSGLSPADTIALKVVAAGGGDLADLTAPGLLSGVSYDASNRATAWTIDGVTYTANYSATGITVAGSDGTITNVGVDPAQRITSVTTA
jgi:hypothetical protein